MSGVGLHRVVRVQSGSSGCSSPRAGRCLAASAFRSGRRWPIFEQSPPIHPHWDISFPNPPTFLLLVYQVDNILQRDSCCPKSEITWWASKREEWMWCRCEMARVVSLKLSVSLGCARAKPPILPDADSPSKLLCEQKPKSFCQKLKLQSTLSPFIHWSAKSLWCQKKWVFSQVFFLFFSSPFLAKPSDEILKPGWSS